MSEPDLVLLDGVSWRGAPLPRGRAQALLAALALEAPRTLSVGAAVEQVWAGEDPAHPDKALQVLVSRARSQTGPEVVARAGAGYRLGLREDQVDLLRLLRLVEEAVAARAAGDLDVARLQARRAMELSVTTAADDGPLGDVVARAGEAQSRARGLLGSVLLARGDATEALPLLEMASALDPGDESRLVEVLRAEAQVRGVGAALAHYASYAARLREEIGAEPGEELRRLHAELLARDAPVRQGLKYDASPMIGRDDDVARIRGLLERSRVVSIVGAGGLGKTRMAHLVGRIAEQPVVHFVELAGVTGGDGVLTEVAGALGVRESVATRRTAQLGADQRARVADALSGPPSLLILDNCEHLVSAVADLVAFLVATTGSTRVLTTSRAPLAIAAEQVYLLPQLGEDDAVQLFDQRARSARADVRLDPEEVRALVARLDGLPLAIELAAAKVRVMSVAEISRRLGDRFALLAGRDRSAPDRHQTLEGVIAWSWNLLDADDQRALRTLATFPDGFSLEGAEALLGHDPLPALVELVDQSLLVVREGEQLRYRFLETVREYGLKQLRESGESAQVDRRLREWGVGLARGLAARLFSPDQVAAMRETRVESGNLAGVMRSALEEQDERVVVPLVCALVAFWSVEGDHLAALTVAREVTELVAEAPDPEPEHAAELRAVLTAVIVTSTIVQGTPPQAALQRLRSLGLAGDHSRADAMTRLLLEAYAGGAPSLEILERLCRDDDVRVARPALQWATQAWENAGDLDHATELATRGLALCDASEGPWTEAMFHAQISSLATQAGDWPRAVEHARLALPVMRAVGADEDVMSLRSVVAYADIAAGRLDEAARIIEDVAADERRAHNLGWSVNSLSGSAELALARGDVDTGLRLYLDCLSVTSQRRVFGVDAPAGLMPWVLFVEACTLFAHVLHGRRSEAEWLFDRVLAKLPTLLGDDAPRLDFPVLGGLILATGSWLMGGEPSSDVRDASLRMIALGHRFGYHRSLPTMAWRNVLSVLSAVDARAPGEVEDLVGRYAAIPSSQLRGEARAAVAALETRSTA